MTLKTFVKSLSAVSTAGLIAMSALPASAQTVATPTADDPFGLPETINIIGEDNPNERTATAVVNGYVITGTDVAHRVALVTSASQAEISPDELERLRVQILRNLIDETLKIQAARTLEVPAERAKVNQTYNQLAAESFREDPKKMDAYLISIGSSSAALKRQIEGELAWDNLLRRNVTPFVNVAAEEVNEVLKRLEESRGTEEHRLGEIYLSATLENRQAVLQNANRIVEQLRAGGSFVAYARQFSEASTAAVGGDLGWLRLEQLPVALATAARGMQIGQLVGPIEVPGGFSILYLTNRRQVLTANPLDAVLNLKQISLPLEPGTTQEQANVKIAEFGKFIEGLRSCADADRQAATVGASVISNQIQAKQLPPSFQNFVLNLQIGQTTPPFATEQQGVGVLMLCGRDDPPAAGAPSFASIERQMEEEKINKRAQRYLRDLRNDAYIEYN